MSATRRRNAARKRRTERYEKNHRRDMLRQGWSSWSLRALSADAELIPAVGTALLASLSREPGLVTTAQRFIDANDDAGVWKQPGESSEEYSARQQRERELDAAAWNWLGERPELASRLRGSNGRNPLRDLGAAMTDQAPRWAGAPAGYGTDSFDDADFELWKLDVFRHGVALREIDADFAAACTWMGAHSHGLWD